MNDLNRLDGISQKYDTTLDYGIVMYDHLPYQRDSDVCNESTVALYSGHIIKYYLCKNETECFVIDNRDDQIEGILQHIRQQEALREASAEEEEVAAEPGAVITEEQIQSLLEDSGETTVEEPEEENTAPVETVNLDDIEDW